MRQIHNIVALCGSHSLVMYCLQKFPKDAGYSTVADSGIQHDLVDTAYEILKKAVSDRSFH